MESVKGVCFTAGIPSRFIVMEHRLHHDFWRGCSLKWEDTKQQAHAYNGSSFKVTHSAWHVAFCTFWIVSCQNIQACKGNPCWEHRTDGSESSPETPWGQQCDVNDHTTVRCKAYLCAAQCKQQLCYYDVNEKPARDDVWMETQQGTLWGSRKPSARGNSVSGKWRWN